MKWASKLSLLTMGLMLATASRSVCASPVARVNGVESGVSPEVLSLIGEGNGDIGPFLAILANPANAGMDDPATVRYQLGRLTSLKALGLTGLGGIGEVAACDMDVLSALTLAVGDAVDNGDAMLLEGQAAQDMIAALVGLPMLGINSLAAVDALATGGDVSSMLAALLTGQATDLSSAVAELQGTETADGITGDTTNLSSGSGGGAWYGGANWHLPNLSLIPPKHHHDSSVGGATASSHHAKHHAAKSAPISAAGSAVSGDVGAGGAVPLPSGVWAALLLIAVLAAAHKAGILRPMTV